MDGLLAELPAGALDEWWEYYQIQPWGDDWERTSVVAAQLTNCIVAMASAWGKKQVEPIEMDAFVPWRKAAEHQADMTEQLAAIDRLEVF